MGKGAQFKESLYIDTCFWLHSDLILTDFKA